jgi:hypothetical protein
MTNKDHNDIQENGPQDIEHEKGALDRLIQVLWRSPLGVFGVGITTVSITLIMIGTIIDMLGLIENPGNLYHAARPHAVRAVPDPCSHLSAAQEMAQIRY